jgi:hypothetical protein
MSGGHFEYRHYRIRDIATEIERLIAQSPEKDYYQFSPETLVKFQEAVDTLIRASYMVQRIDWLVCGDEGEDTFHRRWAEELGHHTSSSEETSL